MKLLFILLAICFCYGCKQSDKHTTFSDSVKLGGTGLSNTTIVDDTPIFHIKVVPFFEDYCIHFTNDNWKTTEDIYETFDMTYGEQPVRVVWQTKLFNPYTGGCEAAIAFARHFKTYKSCVDNNTRTYNEANRIRQYYLLHPPPFRKGANANCNIETNIY